MAIICNCYSSVPHRQHSLRHSLSSSCYVLCAMVLGVSGLNQQLEKQFHHQRMITLPGAGRWYHGRPVMISRNDSALGLFNGDIGIALEQEKRLRVWFPMADGSIKSVLPSRLPEHDTA